MMLTATTPQAGQSVSVAQARLLTDKVLSEWRGRGRIVIFGAGAHTRKILPILEKYVDLISGIADDSPACWGQSIGFWTVGSLEKTVDDHVAGLLVSSDVRQNLLAQRLYATYADRLAILTLYAPPEEAGDGPTLLFTGERQTGRSLAEIDLGHRARYYWALQYLPAGARVLDAACGNGYGTHILATGGLHVLGVDVSPEAVAFARYYYAHATATFAETTVDDDVSLHRATQDLRPYDAVISLETIEHIDRPRLFLRTVHELLKPGGELFCSTPNADTMALADAPYHRHHFTVTETVELLRTAGFEPRAWYGQEGLQILKDRCDPTQRYQLFHAFKTG
ncbi:MAG: methyltransferase domain-containing protein [Planctomycetota bacterium]